MDGCTAEDLARWDALVRANPDGGNWLQGRAYGDFKGEQGWRPHRCVHTLENGRCAAQYLVKRVHGFGELWVCPKGPGVTTVDQLRVIAGQLRGSGAFAVKFEPELADVQATRKQLSALGLLKSAHDLQWNRATVIVDLKPDEEAILQSFKPKTRYNIRLAQRHGVTVEPVAPTLPNFHLMYDLMAEAQRRRAFVMRPREYTYRFWELHTQAGVGQMFFARHEGEVLAAAFAIFFGDKGLYKDGGSKRLRSDVMAPYLLQWTVMRWLKEHQVTEYDLHGTPPADQSRDPSHPLAGLAQFKTGFNSHITEYVGVWDLPLQMRRYHRWQRWGERLALRISTRVNHRLFY